MEGRVKTIVFKTRFEELSVEASYELSRTSENILAHIWHKFLHCGIASRTALARIARSRIVFSCGPVGREDLKQQVATLRLSSVMPGLSKESPNTF